MNINAHMGFEQWEYLFPTSDADVPTCVVPPEGTCSLEIPDTAKYRALIVTDIPENVDWEENVDVSWSCDNHALSYLYLVLSKVSISRIIVGSMVVLLATYFLWRRTPHGASSTITPSVSLSSSDPPLPSSITTPSDSSVTSSDLINS